MNCLPSAVGFTKSLVTKPKSSSMVTHWLTSRNSTSPVFSAVQACRNCIRNIKWTHSTSTNFSFWEQWLGTNVPTSLIPCLHLSWKVHTWLEICASLNHRKKTKADGSRLIPRKHTETLVLLSDHKYNNNLVRVQFESRKAIYVFLQIVLGANKNKLTKGNRQDSGTETCVSVQNALQLEQRQGNPWRVRW